MSDRTGCRNIASHLENRIMSLQQKNGLIFHPHRSERPRFGEQYISDMRKSSKNEKLVRALLANHTSILECTLNILKHDEDELEKQLHYFDVLTSQIQSLQDLIEAEQSLNDALLYLTQIINEYERQQYAIIRIVADSHRDLINHGVLTFQQLERQVDIMTKQVGSKYIVPVGVDVYTLSKIRPYLMGDQYIFKISIQLFKPQMYKMYRIIPVPIQSRNFFEFLWLKLGYKKLIASVDRQTYQFADDINVNECNFFWGGIGF